MMRWWLGRGVDGFRMDVINLISKDPALPDGRVHPGRAYGDGWPFFGCGPRVHEFLQEMRREVFDGREGQLLTVGETPGATVQDAVLFTDPARREVDMVFQFEHVGVDHGTSKWDVLPFDLRALKGVLQRWQVGLADRGWNSLYWNNHDQPRVVSRFGDDGEYRVASAKALGAVLHLQRGTPYVYQGEELGMTNAPFPGISAFRDIESLNAYWHEAEAGRDPEALLPGLRAMSRDNARTPMQWDDSVHAGFTTGTPWLDANPNSREINVAAARRDPDSVLWHYRALIRLRHEEPAVALGDQTMLLIDDPQVFAFTRRNGGTELLVVANLSGEPARIAAEHVPDAAAWAAAEVLLGTLAVADPAGWVLAPWQHVVHRRQV
jgi:oligo-1,6-glucosidase